jgi:hypothetical protein
MQQEMRIMGANFMRKGKRSYLIVVLLSLLTRSFCLGAPTFDGFQTGASDGTSMTTITIKITGGLAGELISIRWEKPPGTEIAAVAAILDGNGKYELQWTIGRPAAVGDCDTLRITKRLGNETISSQNGQWVPGGSSIRAPIGGDGVCVVPALSGWGLVVTSFLLVAGLTIKLGPRRFPTF